MNETFIELINDNIQLVVSPQYGARVISLVDLKRGRNWLVSGGLFPNNKGDYNSLTACGWDECLPNIAKTSNDERDHGILWGNPHDCYKYDNKITSSYKWSDYCFERILTLDRNSIKADYRLQSSANAKKELAYLWSQHCLLSCFPGEKIHYKGIDIFNPPLLPEASIIGDIEQQFHQKTYASVLKKAEVSVGGKQGYISFSWQQKDIPWCGLWLNYGGWPEQSPVHQIAIEPTTLNSEKPDKGSKVLNRGQEHTWQIIISLHDKLI